MAETDQDGNQAMAMNRPWQQSTVIIPLLILIAPVGLYLMWRHLPWTTGTKWAVTVISLCFTALVAASVLASLGQDGVRDIVTLPIENIWVGVAVVLTVTATAIGLLLTMRTHSPEGGFFSDSDRAAAIFGITGTMFSVLLALVILLSVETYRSTDSHSNAEADSVLQQFQLASLFPSREQYAIQSELICYGRSVTETEWPLMGSQGQTLTVDEWGAAIDRNIDTVQIRGSKAETGFHFFLAQNLQRQEERRGRLEGASGTLPEIVWPILLIGAAATISYLIAYADKAERRISQVFQVGLVTFVLGSSLLLIGALDHPFGDNPGQIQPTKMREAVGVMEQRLTASIDAPDLRATLPCDSAGTPRPRTPDPKFFPEGSNMARIAQKGEVVIGVTYGLVRFGELDPVSGEISGFDVALGREIARELGLREDQVRLVDILIEERIPMLQDGKVDMVILALTITPERAELIDFSRPYYLAGQSILVHRQNRAIGGVQDLGGTRVCTVPQSTSEASLRVQAPDAIIVLEPSVSACVTALQARTVDAVSTDDIVLAGFAAEDEDLLLVGGQFTREPYGVGIPLGQRDLAQFIDSVIDRMLEDGRWGQIYYQYLSDIPGLPSVSAAKNTLSSLQLDFGR